MEYLIRALTVFTLFGVCFPTTVLSGQWDNDAPFIQGETAWGTTMVSKESIWNNMPCYRNGGPIGLEMHVRFKSEKIRKKVTNQILGNNEYDSRVDYLIVKFPSCMTILKTHDVQAHVYAFDRYDNMLWHRGMGAFNSEWLTKNKLAPWIKEAFEEASKDERGF